MPGDCNQAVAAYDLTARRSFARYRLFISAVHRGGISDSSVLHGFSTAVCGYRLHFWRSHDGVEVDVLCETAEGFVAIEVKASSRWDKRFNRGLHRVRDDLGKDGTRYYGVYLGERAALWDDVHVLPLVDFLKRLWAGEIISVG